MALPPKIWSYSSPKERNVKPYDPVFTDADGGKVYFAQRYDKAGFYASNLLCLDAQTGEEQWRFVEQHLVNAPIVDTQGRVYISSFAGIVYAFAPDGTCLWQTKVAARNLGRVAFAGANRIAVGETGGQSDKSWCLSRASGEILWSAVTGGHSYPLVASNNLIIHSVAQQESPDFHSRRYVDVIALDADNGRVRWRTSSDDYLTHPIIADDIVIFSGRGAIKAFAMKDGAVLAHHQINPDLTIYGGMSRFGDVLIYVCEDDLRMIAIRLVRTKRLFGASYAFEPLWTVTLEAQPLGRPQLWGGRPFIALDGGILAFFDPETGAETDRMTIKESSAHYAVMDKHLLMAAGRSLSCWSC